MALTPGLTEYFEAVAARAGDVRAAANWVMGEFSAHLNATGLEAGSSPVTPDRLAALVALIGDGTLSSTGAKQVFAGLVADPAATAAGLVGSLGLAQVGDADELGAIVAAVLAANPAEVEAFRGGKTQLVGFFTGQVMKASGGRADPKVVQGILRDRLGS
jgi:aspartyl-tRNA(Asn)/glutamyl-tRNA(Gln) amidotransferase subunit B